MTHARKQPRWLRNLAMVMVFFAAHCAFVGCVSDGPDAHAPLATSPGTTSAISYVLPPGRESDIQSLVSEAGWGGATDALFRFGNISIETSTITYRVVRAEAEGNVVAELMLKPLTNATPQDETSISFAISTRIHASDAASRSALSERLSKAVASVQSQDQGDFYREIVTEVAPVSPVGEEEPRGYGEIVIFVLLVMLTLLLTVVLLWRRSLQFAAVVRLNHAVPALLQTIIFAYWSIYWPGMLGHAELIAIQLVAAFVLDAGINLAIKRRWSISFSPIPIVLSANLFVQFPEEEMVWSLVIVALAVASKVLITRKGRHIFNPSAFGIAVVVILGYPFWPEAVTSGDHANEFSTAANMSELIILIALIVQLRVPIVLASLSAALVLQFTQSAYDPEWAPVLLVLTLLITDPSTMPKTSPGRVLFGLTYGFLATVFGLILIETIQQDFYGKIFPVPICNYLVPWFDRWGERLPKLLGRILEPRWNKAHVALYFAFVTSLIMGGGKTERFHASVRLHGAQTNVRYLKVEPGGEALCHKNPLFCEPFSFLDEVQELSNPDASGTGPRR